ncbi:hypothetical protein [Silvibacterium dinghuense]|uniref:Uncharacterized protein n=1 Tax=Silvibacterium dinghuense TaxID=1560006 RepID=A0A4Q1SJ41_9BACT|nr:hypothetical protein [Silvibacterium dinghuense]RXS97429.1 hypothetical protein ESZ00_05905 [Silvibacterium dinghuense]GGG98954.1 hypothetical protein GCM10011586_13040 [Silvibacterium dinghuense]
MTVVMDTEIKIGTRTYGTSDHLLPPLGPRIPFNGSPAFQEWDEVTGNVMREIRGNLIYNQTGNMTSVLSGTLDELIETDHIYLLMGNLTATVSQKSNLTFFGPYMQLNGSTRTEHFTGKVTRQYEDTLSESQPETWLQYFKDIFHRYDFRVTLYDVLKLDVCVAAVSINGAKFDVSMWKGDINMFKLDTASIDAEIKKFKATVSALWAKTLVTGALIAVLRFGTPFKPNALPAPTPITPFD